MALLSLKTAVLTCICLFASLQGSFSKLNVATVNVKNDISTPLNVSLKSSNCYKCLDLLHQSTENGPELLPGASVDVEVDTRWPLTIYLNSSPTDNSASMYYHFSAGATYNLTYNSTVQEWGIHLVRRGENTYLPILYATLVLGSLAMIWVAICYLYSYVRLKGYLRYLRFIHTNSTDRIISRDLGVPKSETTSSTMYGSTQSGKEHLIKKINTSLNSSLIADGTSEVSPRKSNGHLPEETTTVGVVKAEEETDKKSPKTSSTRLISLDSFRGFSLVIMIFVNYGGGGYWFFQHSKWNGLTVADLVFPWFIWIMGVSIVFSYKGRKKDTLPMRLYQVFRRTIILFALGLFLNVEGTPFNQWRIPGVLQRFSVSYFVVAMTELGTSELYARWKFQKLKPLRDITNNWVQWILIFVLTFIWLAFTFLLPLPDPCPTGYLGPGGIAEWGRYRECTGGAARIIDHWILTDNHFYQSPTAREIYLTDKPYDPEGILGSLTSIVLCFLGVQAGRILTHFKGRRLSIIVRFIIWGVVLGGLGTILCFGTKNEGPIPINKNLWSLSFILVMSGTGCIAFVIFYIMIDALKFWNGSPFRYPGMNSIIVYVGHEVFQRYFPFSWVGQEDSHLTLLSANLIGTCMWMIIAYYWYIVGFFVKI